VPEHPFGELVARVTEALRKARRDRPTQIVRGELLRRLLSSDRKNRIQKARLEILRHPLDWRPPISARQEVFTILRLRYALENLHRLRHERHDVDVIALVFASGNHHQRLIRVDPADAGRSPFIAPTPREEHQLQMCPERISGQFRGLPHDAGLVQ
jgi:hypothetical protein